MSAAEETLRETLSTAIAHSDAPTGATPPATPPKLATGTPPAPLAAVQTPKPEGYTGGAPSEPLRAVKTAEGELKEPLKPPSGEPEVLKAPASWKPAQREKWGTLPREVQEEVLRREVEIGRGLQDASDSRKFHKEMQETLQPYQHLLHLGGLNPAQNIKALLDTVNSLRMGSPYQRSEILAKVILDYGADLPTLDSALAKMLGKTGSGGQPNAGGAGADIDRIVGERMAPVLSFMQQLQRQGGMVQQDNLAKARTEFETFIADPTNEFIKDVAGDMADILDLHAARGQIISLPDAYKRASMMNPEISGIMAQRSLQTAAGAKAAEAAAALKAGGGISASRGSAASGDDSGDDLRATITRSIAALQ